MCHDTLGQRIPVRVGGCFVIWLVHPCPVSFYWTSCIYSLDNHFLYACKWPVKQLSLPHSEVLLRSILQTIVLQMLIPTNFYFIPSPPFCYSILHSDSRLWFTRIPGHRGFVKSHCTRRSNPNWTAWITKNQFKLGEHLFISFLQHRHHRFQCTFGIAHTTAGRQWWTHPGR